MYTRWYQFWFSDSPRNTLCLLRIFVGTAALLKFSGFTDLWKYSNPAFGPSFHFFASEETYFLAHYRMPYPYLEWLPVPSFDTFQTLESILLLLACFFTIGLATRLTGPLLAVLYAYTFFLSQFFYHHHALLLLISLSIIGFSRANEHYSLDAYLWGGSGAPLRPVVPLRLLQIQVTFLYLGSFVNKLNDGWYTGVVVGALRDMKLIGGYWADLLFSYVSEWLLGILVLVIVGNLIWMLWVPSLRRFALYMGICLHVGIDSMISTSIYSYLVMVLYISFLYPQARQYTVRYDARSIVQRGVVRVLGLLDWLQRMRFVHSFSDASATASGHVQTGSFLSVVDGNGTRHDGVFAATKIAQLMPLTFLLYPLWICIEIFAEE